MPTTANVIAKNNSKLWVISRKDFKELIDNIPELKEKIKDILKKRIQENKKKDPNFPLSDLPEILK
jgi:CRP-like cAMP-binding protein